MNERDNWELTETLSHELGRGDPFAAAVRSTRMAMLITDPRQSGNPILFANDAFQKLTGYDRDELLGQNCRMLQGEDTDPDTVAMIRDAVMAEEDISVDILNTVRTAPLSGTPFTSARPVPTMAKCSFFCLAN